MSSKKGMYKLVIVAILAFFVFSIHLIANGGIPEARRQSFNTSFESKGHRNSYHRKLLEANGECRTVHSLPKEERCAYVVNTPDCSEAGSLLPYYEFIYCKTGNAIWGGMIVLVLWWLFLFVGLAVCADDFFCPSLVVISKTLRLSPNVAGVTFLAFGNGAPDFFSALTALTDQNDSSELGIGGLFGAGVFVTSCVVGAICLVKPFKASSRPFLRDILFYLGAVYWAFFMLWKEKVYFAEAVGYCVVYVTYVIVVVVSGSIYRRRKKKATEKTKAKILSIKKKDGQFNMAFTGDGINRHDSFPASLSLELKPSIGETLSVIGEEVIPNEKSLSLDTQESVMSFSSANNLGQDPVSNGKVSVYSLSSELKPSIAETLSVIGEEVIPNGKSLSLDTQESVVSFSSANNLGQDPVSNGKVNEASLGDPVKNQNVQDSDGKIPIWKIFLYGINPINIDDWPDMHWYAKFYEVFKSPLQLLISLTCPVVRYEVEKTHNWNRPLNTLHCLVGPTVACVMLGFTHVHMSALPLWAFFLIVGAVLAIAVFFTSKNDKKPKYHFLFGYIGFVVSLVWIYLIAGEIVELLQCFGVVMNISDAILGLTLLAWGNSIGDMVSNTIMARQGFSRMGFSACFGAPLFNLTLGFGLSLTIKMARQGTNETPLLFTPVQFILGMFLIGSLVSSFIALNIMKFKVKRAYGLYLLFLYIVFLVVAILTEYGMILQGLTNKAFK